MGALIAFEVIRELRRRGAPMPVQLFAAARRSAACSDAPKLAHLPREAFLRQVCDDYYGLLHRHGGTGAAGIILPVLRADLVCETLLPNPLRVPDSGVCRAA
jgi:medium-chain acyl-[acyl-carrier-protein] hydrolase